MVREGGGGGRGRGRGGMPGKQPSHAAVAEAYLRTQNCNELVGGMLEGLIVEKPMDTVQFLIDHLEGRDARQDENGLSAFRRNLLEGLFKKMDKDGGGSIDINELKEYVVRFGGDSVSDQDIMAIAADIDTDGNGQIEWIEFLLFFARSLNLLSNQEFEAVVNSMLE